mmetsp:Transcript_6773/g.17558  ORF Transcript_6773/g.17558 Transcript_6773/m.17558 type:complete len:211 (+) Transcript_6773:3-635(+)
MTYIAESSSISLSELEARNEPLTTLQLHPSIAIAQSGSPKAAAAKFVRLEPFSKEVATHAFIAADSGVGIWYGQPIVGLTLTTLGGVRYEVLYVKWLDHELTGLERLKLPLPATFPMHQWAKSLMGLPPTNGWPHQETDCYALIDASKVLNWEPIVCIGLRSWRPTSTYVEARRQQGKRRRKANEKPPPGVGEPLFVNNVHAWSFGDDQS